jgi:hypothetical protein
MTMDVIWALGNVFYCSFLFFFFKPPNLFFVSLGSNYVMTMGQHQDPHTWPLEPYPTKDGTTTATRKCG